MPRTHVCLLLLFANLAFVLGFAPMIPMASEVATPVVELVSKSPFSGVDSMLLSVVEESEVVTKQGLINWDNPGEAIMGSITLLYIAFSIAAGIKYVVVDGYRPKM